MECVVLAGGVPQEEDLLYEVTQGLPKALIDVAGKPMVQWVLDALDQAPSVSSVIVVGLSPDSGVGSPKVVDYMEDHGSMLGNAIAGTERALALTTKVPQLLMCGADIPLLTPDMVEALIRQCPDPAVDLYHAVVSREHMEARFPDSRRSYARFLEGDVAACDIHIIAPGIVHKHPELWKSLMENRKNVIKQALNLGPGFFIKYAAGRLSLAEVERIILRKFGIHARAVFVTTPEMGMDADKPFQLEICRRELAQRGEPR